MSVKYERDGWAFSIIQRIDSQRSPAPAWAVFALALSDPASPRRPIQLAILGFEPSPQLFIAICDNWLELAPRERGLKPSA